MEGVVGGLGTFTASVSRGVEVIHRLISAFYDERFSFGEFLQRFPEQRRALIDCLVGDVMDKDMNPLLNALALMAPPAA